MNKTGKVISAVMVLLITAYTFSLSASAALLGKDGFYYEFSNGNAILKEYHSSNTEVEIPESVYSYEVTAIADHTFLRNTSITSVIIPESVTKIGDSAFYGCTNLEGIFIPDSVTSFGSSIFSNCENVVIICYPDSSAETYAQNNNINYQLIGKKAEEDPEPVQGNLMGDVDGDGTITTVDSLLVLRNSVGIQSFDETQLTAADVDGDGLITSSDSLFILRYCVGFVEEGVNIGTEF